MEKWNPKFKSYFTYKMGLKLPKLWTKKNQASERGEIAKSQFRPKMLSYLGLSSASTPEPLETDNSPVPRRFFVAPNDDPTFHDDLSSSSSHEESSLHFDGSALLLGLWECADQARTTVLPDESDDSKQGTPTTEEKVQSMLRHVECGLTTIDAADHYGDSEKIISNFLQLHGAKHPIEICTFLKYCFGHHEIFIYTNLTYILLFHELYFLLFYAQVQNGVQHQVQ